MMAMMHLGIRFLLVVAVTLLATSALSPAAEAPRVAVWDPQFGTTSNRFELDQAELDRISATLANEGAVVQRITAEQIADSAEFSAAKFDAIVFMGNAVPRSAIEPLKRFADEGGVTIALAADVPFLIAIEPHEGREWALSPAEPKFAWQTTELLKHFGLRYIYKLELHDQGVYHTATPLLKRYVADAPDLRGKRPSRWIVPDAGSQTLIYPLLRSQRRDHADVPPQLYLVRNGPRAAIISTMRDYTAAEADDWPHGPQTLVALAHLARDVHTGALQLTPEMAVSIDPDLQPIPPSPLDRMASASVDPEGAKPLVRWGAFDGSKLEFSTEMPAGELEVPLGAPTNAMPGVLAPGTVVRLALPELTGGPLYFRIRGAYDATGAGLKVSVGEQVILNESFVYVDTSTPSNFSRSLAGQATEFTRIVFLPPVDPAVPVLAIANPGNAPLYLDALQIEQRDRPAPERVIGLGAGYGNNYSPELSRQWSAVRMSLRTNFIGPPDDPDRFAKVDELFNRIHSLNPRVQPILEGTPPWAAITPERLAEAQAIQRPHTVPPDPQKYAQIVEDVIARYGDRIESYEIWNEADIDQFYRGTEAEYITLFKTIVPIIRRLDPTARILSTGMAGMHEDFLRKMWHAGVLDEVDLIAFHPYAGKRPAWDTPYGLLEGTLMSWGVNREIFCNESGFTYLNAAWFQPPPVITPKHQRDLLNTAMARLLANGLAKLSIFHAGGDDHPYSLIDSKGRPRLAYQVFADYVQLGQPGARRLDVQMTHADGLPLEGVYTAASVNEDGSVVVIVNPADNEQLLPKEAPSMGLIPAEKWTAFFGDARYDKGTATISPAPGQAYAGFYKHVVVDTDRYPTLEVQAEGDQADWELLLKLPDGSSVSAIARRGPGQVQVNYRDLLPSGGRQTIEVSFRLHAPTTLRSVRFVEAEDATQQEVEALPIRLCIPLSEPFRDRAVLAEAGDPDLKPQTRLHRDGSVAWAAVTFPLRTRTVIHLRPGNE